VAPPLSGAVSRLRSDDPGLACKLQIVGCQEGPTEPGFSLETEQVKLRAALGAYIDADLTSAASDSGLRTAALAPPSGVTGEHSRRRRIFHSVGGWFEWEYESGAVWGYDPAAVDWSDDVGFETPEEAAASDIPPRFARIDRVRYHDDGNHAVVELLTNEEPHLYPYTVFCVRDSLGRWHDAGGHN
jgi:hypothetical protein